MDLTDIEDATRIVLRDDASADWSDTQLDSAIALAVAEYSRSFPARAMLTGAESTSSLRLDLEGLDTITLPAPAADTQVDALEWPIDQVPKSFVRFTRWGNVLTLDTAEEIAAEAVNLFVHTPHQLATGAYATIPSSDLEPIATGAAGYALRALAAESSQALTTQPREAERFRALAEEHLSVFRSWLRRRHMLEGQAFRPADAYRPSRFADPGPQ